MPLSPEDIRRQQQTQRNFFSRQYQQQQPQQRQQSPNPAATPNLFSSSSHLFSLTDAQPSISTPLNPPIPNTTTPISLHATPSPRSAPHTIANNSPHISNASPPQNNVGGTGGFSSPFSAYNSTHGDFRSGGTTPSFGPEHLEEIEIDINDWHYEEEGSYGGGLGGGKSDSAPFTTSTLSTLTINPTATAGTSFEEQISTPHQPEQHHTWPVTLGSKSPPPPPIPPAPQGTKRHLDENNDGKDVDGDEEMFGLTQGINTPLRRAETDSSLLSTSSSFWRLNSPIVKVEDVSAGGSGEVRVAYAPSNSSRDDVTETGHNVLSPNNGSLTANWGGRGGRMRSKSDAARGAGLGIAGLPGGPGGIRRDDEGVWVSGGGIAPDRRGSSSRGGDGQYLPMNLTEQEMWKARMEKNLDIEKWLMRSPGTSGKKSSAGGDNNNSLSVPKTRERRAKSISDFRGAEGVKKLLGLPFFGGGEGGGGVAGVAGGLVRSLSRGSKKSRRASRSRSRVRNGDMPADSDSSTDEDSFVDSNFEEGSLDNWSPPAEDSGEMASESELQLMLREDEDEDRGEREGYNLDDDPEYLPRMGQFLSKPDAKPHRQYLLAKEAPAQQNANAAIQRFREYVDNMETASRVATHGSSREPAAAIMTAREAERYMETEGYGLFKRMSIKQAGFGSGSGDAITPRRPSIFEFPFKGRGLKRTPSNSVTEHREKDTPRSPTEAGGDGTGDQQGEQTSIAGSMKWKTPFAQRRGKLSIDTAIGTMVGQLAAIGAGEGSAVSPGGIGQLSPPGGASLGGLKRTRSQSGTSKLIKQRPTGLSRSPSAASAMSRPAQSNLQSLMLRHGGPPALPITSPKVGANAEPANTHIIRRHTDGSQISPSAMAAAYDSDDEETIAPPMSSQKQQAQQQQPTVVAVRLPIITPTLEGYAENVRAHAPDLEEILVRRISTEQQKRYKKLLDHRSKHIALVRNGKCPSKARCAAALPLPAPATVQPPPPNSAGAAADPAAVTPLQFPPNIPPPPVPRLPATFECPICFKLKNISKPSDWTKHVHEDVQPFTCTFPDCNEPKSFKRKADWVRHENERHRHLEWWRCNQPECTHICYRKDNFVQHLVREHKMPEPKAKTGPSTAGRKKNKDDHGISTEHERVWAIVDFCRNETKVQPETEKCRFCGQTCPTWKKLTVHLARHMEKISLPILELVGGPGERAMQPGADVLSVYVVPADEEHDGDGDDDDDDAGGPAGVGNAGNSGSMRDEVLQNCSQVMSLEKSTVPDQQMQPQQQMYYQQQQVPPPQIHFQQQQQMVNFQQYQQLQLQQQQQQQQPQQQPQEFYSLASSSPPQLLNSAYHPQQHHQHTHPHPHHVSPQQQFYPSPQTPTSQTLPAPLQSHLQQQQQFHLMDQMRGGLGMQMQMQTPSPNSAGGMSGPSGGAVGGAGFGLGVGMGVGVGVGVGMGVEVEGVLEDDVAELEGLGMGWVAWD